jgi:hypothetical protein
MKPHLVATVSLVSTGIFTLATPKTRAAEQAGLFARDNLAAWCIVPFDKNKRNPEQRAEMLARIKIHKFVYDYRSEHVPQWEEELKALQRHGIELTGWMFNSAPDKDDPSKLNAQSLGVLEMFERHKVKPQLWVIKGGSSVLAGSPEEQERRVAAEVTALKPAALAAQSHDLKLGLYNHGGWFGEPENQLEIIERLKKEGIQNVGIVYNQHWGHGHLGRFPQLLQKIIPHLICLNINGMDVAGQSKGRMILPIGGGTEDLQLLRVIRDSGYKGPIGILNHTGEDAEVRLKDNLNGLSWLSAQLEGKPAGPKPEYLSWKDPAPATP